MEEMMENRFSGMDYIDLIQPYNEAMKNISTRIDTLMLDYNLTYHIQPIHHVESRLKTKESIQGKLLRKHMALRV